MSILDQVKDHRKNIKYEQITFSLWELVGMHLANPKEIVIRPDFQRLFRWSREKQSNFIESLLLEIPIPPLFFFENPNGTWDLLDGLQRISTIIRFMGAEKPIPPEAAGTHGNDNDWHYESEHDIDSPLQLIEGHYLRDMKGLTFRSLPTQLQLNLKRTRLNIFVLKRETHSQYKYEVFKRINTGGSLLEEQEIRSASIRLIDDKFALFLEKLGSNESFENALGLKDEYSRNGYLQELVLRFFAMKNKSDIFKHDVANFLTDYMEEVAKGNYEFNFDSEENLFHRVFKIINSALPEGSSFRGVGNKDRSVGPFSPALYEGVTVGIAHNIDYMETLKPETAKEKIISFIRDMKSKGYTGGGSNAKSKTIGRLNAGKLFFKNK